MSLLRSEFYGPSHVTMHTYSFNLAGAAIFRILPHGQLTAIHTLCLHYHEHGRATALNLQINREASATAPPSSSIAISKPRHRDKSPARSRSSTATGKPQREQTRPINLQANGEANAATPTLCHYSTATSKNSPRGGGATATPIRRPGLS